MVLTSVRRDIFSYGGDTGKCPHPYWVDTDWAPPIQSCARLRLLLGGILPKRYFW